MRRIPSSITYLPGCGGTRLAGCRARRWHPQARIPDIAPPDIAPPRWMDDAKTSFSRENRQDQAVSGDDGSLCGGNRRAHGFLNIDSGVYQQEILHPGLRQNKRAVDAQ